MSGFGARWRILSDLLVELRAHGADIPPYVVRDLRSARSLIEVLKADPGCEGVAGRIDMLLTNVESFLLAEVEMRLGPEAAKEWEDRISKAISEAEGASREAGARFRPGLPRGEHWIRVRPSEEIPRELVEELARTEGVSVELQPDGYLLVRGEEGKVKSFVRKMAERLRGG